MDSFKMMHVPFNGVRYRGKPVLHFLRKAIGYAVYYLSKLFPRKVNKWCFGCETGFDGNAKYLFFDVVYNHPEINAVWITHRKAEAKSLRSKGFKAFHWLHPAGIWHCFTAKVYIATHQISDINAYTSGNAFYVNIWHGVGVKKMRWLKLDRIREEFGYSSVERMCRSIFFKIEMFYLLYRKPDLMLVPSRFQADQFFAPMMDIPLSDCFLGGYLRNGILQWNKERILDFVRRYEPHETLSLLEELNEYKKVYIYMPTWRKDKPDFMADSDIDWAVLDETLKAAGAILLLKLHPRTCLNGVLLAERYDNIRSIPDCCDIQQVLPFTDCLITDYSSVYADYCLLNKEIILFPFDYDSYVRGSHELPGYDRYYLGRRAYSFEELLDLIRNRTDCHLTEEEHAFVMETYWDSAFNGVDIINEIKHRIGML